MGFVDEALNSSLLLRYNNDISSVVDELVRISRTSALVSAPTREAHYDTISTQNASRPHVNQATPSYTNQHYSPAMPHSSPSGGYPQATVDGRPHTDSMDSQAAQHFVDGPQYHSNGGRKHLGELALCSMRNFPVCCVQQYGLLCCYGDIVLHWPHWCSCVVDHEEYQMS